MHTLSHHALAATVVAGLCLTAAAALAAPKVVVISPSFAEPAVSRPSHRETPASSA